MMRLLALVLLLAGCDARQEAMTAPRPVEPLQNAAGKGSPFQYPEELWEAQVSGETLLRLYISEQGAVDSVRVERTSGFEAFDAAALAGSRSLRFEPARRGDEPVGAWFILPVKFDSGAAGDTARDPSPKSVGP
jgi:protein TonB